MLFISCLSFFIRISLILQFLCEASIEDDQVPKLSTNSAVKYLSRFGYLPKSNPRKKLLITEDGFHKALKQLQHVGGIEETGVLDEATVELINTPRCGMSDSLLQENDNLKIRDIDVNGKETIETKKPYYPVKKRKKRFALQGSRWKTRFITYKVGKYPSRLSNSQVCL